MEKKIRKLFCCAAIIAVMLFVAKICVNKWFGPVRRYTDGIVTAEFNKEAGILSFSGNGAVDDTWNWLDMNASQRRFVRTIFFEDGITAIGDCEFCGEMIHDYINLGRVIFEGDIAMVGACAFADNPNLRYVEFGGRCARIKSSAFSDCVSLQDINVPDGCRVDYGAFSGTPKEGVLFNAPSPDPSQEDPPPPAE